MKPFLSTASLKFNYLTIVYILSLALLCTSCAIGGDAITVTDLRCENLRNPNTIQQDHPRFSWVAESSIRGDMQTAVQVLVASSPELLPDAPDVWNSGKVESNEK